MRICSPQLGLAQKSVLGGEVFDREILLGLAQKKVQVEIILPKGKDHDKHIHLWHINFIPISHFPPQLFNLLILPYLFKVNLKKKIDIIRLHQPQFTGFGAILFKLFNRKVKILASYHKFEETSFGPISKFMNSYWDHIITDSFYVKGKIIKSHKTNPDKITVVHNGVPAYLKPQLRDKILEKKLGLQGKTVLLFMGLFNNRKNPLFLIDILHKISKRNPNVVLLFWGQGPLKEKIQLKAQSYSIEDKIRFTNPVFGSEKNKIHNLADIFVHPSLDEGFALAPLESMACAKPVVMTRGYSAQEAVDEKVNGFLCKENNLEDWVFSLEKLIQDNNLRVQMGKESLEKVKKEFQWDLAIQKHLEVLQSLSK